MDGDAVSVDNIKALRGKQAKGNVDEDELDERGIYRDDEDGNFNRELAGRFIIMLYFIYDILCSCT